jgi:hypothetical protein
MTIIKWLGTILIILATIFRAIDMHVADMACTLIGASAWAYAAWRTNDKALLTINLFSVLIMIAGIYHSRGD